MPCACCGAQHAPRAEGGADRAGCRGEQDLARVLELGLADLGQAPPRRVVRCSRRTRAGLRAPARASEIIHSGFEVHFTFAPLSSRANAVMLLTSSRRLTIQCFEVCPVLLSVAPA